MAKKKNPAMDLTIAYKDVFNSEQGERVLFDLMKKHFVLSPIIPARATRADADLAMYREGQRSVVVSILQTAKVDLEQMAKMVEVREKEERQKNLEYMATHYQEGKYD